MRCAGGPEQALDPTHRRCPCRACRPARVFFWGGDPPLGLSQASRCYDADEVATRQYVATYFTDLDGMEEVAGGAPPADDAPVEPPRRRDWGPPTTPLRRRNWGFVPLDGNPDDDCLGRCDRARCVCVHEQPGPSRA